MIVDDNKHVFEVSNAFNRIKTVMIQHIAIPIVKLFMHKNFLIMLQTLPFSNLNLEKNSRDLHPV